MVDAGMFYASKEFEFEFEKLTRGSLVENYIEKSEAGLIAASLVYGVCGVALIACNHGLDHFEEHEGWFFFAFPLAMAVDPLIFLLRK